MKTKLILGLVFMVNLAFAQNIKPILGKDFAKYVHEMDAYYQNRDKGKGSGYKQYMRKKMQLETLVGREGIIKNFDALNMDAFHSVKQQKAPGARAAAVHGLWEDLGPKDYSGSDSYSNNALGRLNCMAFHPTDINTIWVGAPLGGLWKTTDHGGSWQCISNDFSSIGVSSIAVNPINPNEIYILTGDGDSGQSKSIGILKTTDGGITWKETGLKFGVDQDIVGFVLRMHPTNPNILLAGYRNNIYKTVDAGNNWTIEDTSEWVWDIEFKPGNPTIMYAATWSGILKSTDTGNTWAPMNSGFPTDPAHPTNPKNWNRLSLAVSPSAPNNVYVLCGGVPMAGQFSGMFKSTDQAATWVRNSNSPNIFGDGGGDARGQTDYDICLTVNPTNDTQIFMGGINCWKSDNSGVNWSRETNWQRIVGAVDPFVHADFHDIQFRGQRVYAANDGGIYFSDDYGHSWADISSGLGVTQFYNIDIDGSGWIGGTQDNGANEAAFSNTQMHNIGGGDSFGAVWHAGDHSIQFITSQDYIARRQFGSNLFIYQDGGQFWDCTLKNATNNSGILFGIHSRNQLVRGNQASIFAWDWSWYNTGNGALEPTALKGYSQGVDNPNIMYVAHWDTLMKTSSIYTTPAPWVGLTQPAPGLTYDDILVDPANSNNVWVVCNGYNAGNKVFKSTTGGTAWLNISQGLPNVPVLCIAKLPGVGEKLYIGTTIGVFYRDNTMTQWVYYANNLPNVAVYDIKLNSTHVYAGTFGRGIWRSELYSGCISDLVLTPANETATNPYEIGTQVISAINTIQSTRVYQGSVGTNIYYNGGQFVDLKPGFEIKTDAFMEVKNKGCPN